MRVLQTAVVSENNVVQSDVSAILSSNRGRELEEVRAVLGRVLDHLVLPVPDVPLVSTQLPESPRLTLLGLQHQLEVADTRAVHVVVEDDLTLVVGAEPGDETAVRTLSTDQHLPWQEDLAEDLCLLSLLDRLGAVDVEIVSGVVEAGVVESWSCPSGGAVARSSLPLEEAWGRGLELSEGFVLVLEC